MPDALFKPPYYAVIFTSRHTFRDEHEYGETAALMDRLAAGMPGYLGVENARDPASGEGITVSYWRDEASILAWKKHTDHAAARQMGRDKWYAHYALRVAKVEREYDFHAPPGDGSD